MIHIGRRKPGYDNNEYADSFGLGSFMMEIKSCEDFIRHDIVTSRDEDRQLQ